MPGGYDFHIDYYVDGKITVYTKSSSITLCRKYPELQQLRLQCVDAQRRYERFKKQYNNIRYIFVGTRIRNIIINLEKRIQRRIQQFELLKKLLKD